jgi:hypothetical protein
MLLKEKNDQKGPLQEYSKIKGSSFCSGKFMVPMTAKIWVKSQLLKKFLVVCDHSQLKRQFYGSNAGKDIG